MAAFRGRLPSTEELLSVAKQVHADASARGTPGAILGGLAMSLYGSDRLTKDVDFVSDRPLDPNLPGLVHLRTIGFGGDVYGTTLGVNVDWIVRADHYRDLYLDALGSATEGPEAVPVVRMEQLAAIKLAASTRDPKHYEDLLFLLAHPDLDIRKAKNLVFRHVGGAFAVEQFEAAEEEAKWRKSKSE